MSGMEVTLFHPDPPARVQAVSSKSDVHRLLICAALADVQTVLFCPDRNADILATARVLTALGARLSYENGAYTVDPIQIPPRHEVVLDCGESGSTLRFILPVAAALGVSARLCGQGRLLKRPMGPLTDCLCAHGAQISAENGEIRLCGRLTPGCYEIAGDVSSQYITGLLLALPLLDGPSRIRLTSPLESAPYVDMTLDALSRFGVEAAVFSQGYALSPSQLVSPGCLRAQGDWSGAAFWLACGAIGPHPVHVEGLAPESRQGDREICALLSRFGAKTEWKGGAVTVSPAPLHGIEIQAQDIPDLVPVLAVTAAAAQGETRITGAARLRMKESDRLETVSALLRALGGEVRLLPDGLCIRGTGQLHGGRVDGANDHRIVMSAAVAALICREPLVICGAEAVAKTYPGFFDLYRTLDARK